MTLKALFPVTQQFQAKNGSNLVGGKIYIYYQGRTALATTYHDEEGTVINANPVLLDNNGRAAVFANTIYSYTIVVCDYYGKELFSQDITLHDAISTAEKVMVMGSNGSVKVDTTTLPNGVQYDMSVNTDIIATKKSVDDVKTDLNTLTGTVNNHTTQIGQIQEDIVGIESTVANKKDKQNELNFNGSATKTIKSITQNANGELNVEFEDISAGGISAGEAIDLTNNAVSVKYSKGLEVNSDNELQVYAGKGLFLTADGKLTTEEPEENFIDITNEWVFMNNFRLSYNGVSPGYGNDMRILYSPVSDTVKFTSSCRINRTAVLDNTWNSILQYKGNRFYTSYNAPNADLAPVIGLTATLGNINFTIATDVNGITNKSLLKVAYTGAPTTDEKYCALAVQPFMNNGEPSIYGCVLSNLILKVHKKV